MGYGELLGEHESIRAVRELVARIAASPARTVLLYGETGTGKGLVARMLHRLSSRAAKPFVDVNCAAIPASLMESELFGHERGAFTGAAAAKPGLIESADGGTLFLDEIREMDLQLQAKLLTLLDTQRFRRLGAVRQTEVDVRFVASTNRILLSEVKAGRASDCALFAAPLLNAGLSPATAYYAGKLMECASFCCEPFMGKESILGRIREDDIRVTALHPGQRCTPASLASHAMYERRDPFREHVVSGYVDMSACRYEQIDERTTRASGARFVAAPEPMVKIEGAGKVGERRLAIVGMRDPYMIANVDKAIAWARARLAERFGAPEEAGWQVFYHLYGRDGVMGPMEPCPPAAPHEIGVVVETLCRDGALAEEICALAARNLFYARLPEVKGTAGAAALMSDEVLTGKPGYEWTLNHVMPVKDPCELFRTRFVTVSGAARRAA
jgi:hypothetical protein